MPRFSSGRTSVRNTRSVVPTPSFASRRQPSADAEALVPSAPPQASQKVAKEMGRKLDALLDEIDDILERNAQEFLAGYVQHEGE